MVWTIDGPQGNESGKIKWEIVKYTRGRGLDVGCGVMKTFPHFIGVDSGKDGLLYGAQISPDVRCETAACLPMFASGSMDFVFSSHLLEHFPLLPDDPKNWENHQARLMAQRMRLETHTAGEALKEWMRVLKTDGYLILYLPDEDQYPKVGEEGANPDHCFNVNFDTVMQLMRDTGYGWDLVDFQKRSEGIEYSLYFVFQKRNSKHRESWAQRSCQVSGGKTCGVVRYGAFGDLLQCSSVLAALKKQGYHITVYTSPPGDEVIRHDPNVDAFYIQDKDQVPNHCLADFWAYHARKYDKWVNLSESVECTLLSIPNRTPHLWSPAARHRYMNHNYVEMQHLIAQVPFDPQVHFFPTDMERQWAIKERHRLGGSPLILWALTGSSVHKTWGGLDQALARILLTFPTAHVVLVGGPDAVILEGGWEQEPRIKRRSGAYSIRQTLSLVQQVDVMIGPETGVMNAGAQLPIPKVVFLSHSTHENLTRDWVNCVSIAAASTKCPGRGDNEAPACHQMHYDWRFCQQFRQPGHSQDGTAQCQRDIDPDQAFGAIYEAISKAITPELIRA